MIPPLGWDTITYHGPKAVVWVQTESFVNFLDAPGGPSYANNMFGGGEIFLAWSMLVFRSDFAVGIVDAFMWALLAISVFCWISLFIKDKLYLFTLIAGIIFLPAVWLSVGSGYVELTLWTFFTMGLVFLKFYMLGAKNSYIFLSIFSFGLATNVKITVLPVYLTVILVFLVMILVNKKIFSKQFLLWLIGSLLSFSLLLPWIINTFQNTGYFFSVPIEIFNVKLGNWESVIQWYKERDFTNYRRLALELDALFRIFNDPRIVSTHISFVTIIFIPTGIIYLIKEILKKNYEMLIYFIITSLVLLVFYSEDFKTVRLLWSDVTGRFLLPVVIILSVFAFKLIEFNSKVVNTFIFIIVLSSFIQIINGLFWGWDNKEIAFFIFFLSLCSIAIIFLYLLKSIVYKFNSKIMIVVGIIISMISINIIYEFRVTHRAEFIRDSIVLHQVPRFWEKAADILDDPLISYNISITTGPHQNLDNWFIYFFYGKRFQNKITYISPTIDNEIVSVRSNYELGSISKFDVWYARIMENNIDYILCLPPIALEYEWCIKNPDLFQLLEPKEENDTWGIFLVLKKNNH